MRNDQVDGEEMEDSSREIQKKWKGGDLKGCEIKGHLRRGRCQYVYELGKKEELVSGNGCRGQI